MKNTLRSIFFGLLMLMVSFTAVTEQALWFGSYVDEAGQLSQGRYQVSVDSESKLISAVQLAPYGQPTTDFTVLDHDLKHGFLTLAWPNKPEKKINLFRYSDTYYAGNWIDGTQVSLMVLKQFNGQDAEMQGNWFKPSQVEVDVLTHALSLLADEKSWNKSSSRVCDSAKKVTLFCALYFASVAVDGAYRHLRPAIKAVRAAIEHSYPKKYDHVLADFNSDKSTNLAAVRQVLNAARDALIESIQDTTTNQ